jgi:hypothetical protein
MTGFEQAGFEQPGFERHLRADLHGVLDGQYGPHPSWTDSPAARRITSGENHRRVSPGSLRLLALAAVLAVGGAAVAGAVLNRAPVPPLPSQPPPSPAQSAGPAMNGWIAYATDNAVSVQLLDGAPTVIRGAANKVQSCPQFGPDGDLAFANRDSMDSNPTKWQIDVIRLLPGATRYNQVSSLVFDERPDEGGACFEWSPGGDRFAYAPQVGADVMFTIAQPALFSTVFTVGRDYSPVIPDYVRWKPDGSEVAFIYSVDPAGDGTGLYSEIWIAPVGGTSAARSLLKTDPNEIINDVAWSPDGTAVAYRSTRFSVAGDRLGSFVSVLTIGAIQDSIQLDQLDDPDLPLGAGPAWSPDGSQLAWVLGGELRIGDPAGAGWHGLPPVSSDELGTGWATNPVVWSADGTQILSGQLDASAPGPGVKTSVVLYDVTSGAQPTGVLPWRLGGYGRLSWQVVSE